MILAPAESARLSLPETPRHHAVELLTANAAPGSHAETWRRPYPDSNGCLSSTGQWIRTTCGVSWPSTSSTTKWSFGVMSPSASLIRGGGLFHGRVLSGRGPGERSLREPGPILLVTSGFSSLALDAVGVNTGGRLVDHERRAKLLVGCTACDANPRKLIRLGGHRMLPAVVLSSLGVLSWACVVRWRSRVASR